MLLLQLRGSGTPEHVSWSGDLIIGTLVAIYCSLLIEDHSHDDAEKDFDLTLHS